MKQSVTYLHCSSSSVRLVALVFRPLYDIMVLPRLMSALLLIMTFDNRRLYMKKKVMLSF